jgi:hypothetical protein
MGIAIAQINRKIVGFIVSVLFIKKLLLTVRVNECLLLARAFAQGLPGR